MLAGVFAGVWLVTFFPAWYCLMRLLALSGTPHTPLRKIIIWLIIYRVLIALPYVLLLVLGSGELPQIVQAMIIGIVLWGIGISIIRFVWTDKYRTLLWDIYSRVYDGLLHFWPYQKLIQSIDSLAFAQKPQARHILELGCGTGNVLKLLRISFPAAEMTGVDGSRYMLRMAKQKQIPHLTLIQDDMVDYVSAYKPDAFDIVVMQNSLYVLSDEDRAALWRHLQRILRTDGIVVISNPDREGSWPIICEHLRESSIVDLFDLRLIGVLIIDNLINQMSSTGKFHFVQEDVIRQETSPYFSMTKTSRLYGGVDILFALRKK